MSNKELLEKLVKETLFDAAEVARKGIEKGFSDAGLKMSEPEARFLAIIDLYAKFYAETLVGFYFSRKEKWDALLGSLNDE